MDVALIAEALIKFFAYSPLPKSKTDTPLCITDHLPFQINNEKLSTRHIQPLMRLMEQAEDFQEGQEMMTLH